MARQRMLPPKEPRRSSGLQRTSSRTAFSLLQLLLVALLLGAAAANQSLAQNISTVVGGGNNTGDAVLDAVLPSAVAVAFDVNDNLYILDRNQPTVRKVDFVARTITTVAGTGVSGFSGDDGPATSATFDTPEDLAVDASGNIYIADKLNQRVRMVDAATGFISTVAGNGGIGPRADGVLATSTAIHKPYRVAVDAAGNLYISSTDFHTVRKVDAVTHIITTIAGTDGTSGFSGDGGPATAALLYYPGALAFDTSGNLYIADGGNSLIRKITASTGVITTVTGTAGHFASTGDGGPATSAELNGPAYIAVDASGNLYITEYQRIRKVTASTGIISTAAGTGNTSPVVVDGIAATTANLYNPRGVAMDASGNLYIADQQHFRIRKVTTAVSQPPVANNDAATTGEDAALAIAVLANDTDPDGDALTMTGVTSPASGSAAINLDGTVTYAPNSNFNGTDTFTYTISDGRGGTATAAVAVTVVPVNDAPSFTRSPDHRGIEDHGPHVINNWAYALSKGPADEAWQALSFIVSNNNPGLFSAQPAIDPSGRLTYTAVADANGFATVTVQLRDNGGTANGGVDTSAPQTFTIEVIPVNDAPSFAKGADQTVAEDAGAQVVAGWATNLSAGPPDEAGQALSFLVSNDNNGLFSGQPAVNAAGTLTYTPAANANGSATVAVRIKDNGGTVIPGCCLGGVDTSAPQTFAITVIPVNDPPVLAALTPQTVDEGQPLTMALSATDPDSPVMLSVAGAPSGASLVDNHNGTGAFTWTPNYDQAGAYTVSFTASDGNLSDSKSVAITVNNVTRTLSASAGAGGTIDPAGVTTVVYGSSQTFAIAPLTGYHIADVLVDGASVGAVSTYTFTNVTADHTIAASFAALTLSDKVQELVKTVQAMITTGGLPSGTATALNAKLNAAIAAANAGQTKTAVNELNAFLNYVSAQTGKKLTTAQASQLTAAARAIIASTGAAKLVATEGLPEGLTLSQNYPNPFNPATTLRYSLDNLQEVRLAIYNAMGQRVRVLVDQAQGPGSYEVEWNGLDEAGQQVAGGIYFYQLQAGSQQARGRMLFLK